jgi:chromosome segregation ATPase
MSKSTRKRKLSKTPRARRKSSSNSPKARSSPGYAQLIEEIQVARSQRDQLAASNQKLQEQLSKQEQELALPQQQVTDLKAECDSLKQEVELAKAEVVSSRTDTLVSLFKDMADKRHNRLLHKLLAFEEDSPGLLRDVVRYLRDELKLTLIGETGSEIILTAENLDHYEVQEAVTLPCQVRVIGRGISFDGKVIARTEMELVEGKE